MYAHWNSARWKRIAVLYSVPTLCSYVYSVLRFTDEGTRTQRRSVLPEVALPYAAEEAGLKVRKV